MSVHRRIDRRGLDRHRKDVVHPFFIAILRPFVRLSLAGLQSRLAIVPKATDQPRATTEGRDPLNIVILGYGVGPGWGVTTHGLALTGQLSRILSARTGRGVEVEAITDYTTLPWLIGRLKGMDLSVYDAIVLSPGAFETVTLMSLTKWRAYMARVIQRARFQDGERPVVLLGVPPLASIVPVNSLFGGVVRAHGRDLESALRYYTSDPMIEYVPLRTQIDPRDIRPAAAERYRAWAEAVSTALASRLREPEHVASAHRADGGDKLVAFLHHAFGADAAVIASMDGSRVWIESRRTTQAVVTEAVPLFVQSALASPAEMSTVTMGERSAVVAPVCNDENVVVGVVAIVGESAESVDRRLLTRLSRMVLSELIEEVPATVDE